MKFLALQLFLAFINAADLHPEVISPPPPHAPPPQPPGLHASPTTVQVELHISCCGTLGYTRSPTQKEYDNLRIVKSSLEGAKKRLKVKNGDKIVCKVKSDHDGTLTVVQILAVKIWGKIQQNDTQFEFQPLSDFKSKPISGQGIEAWLQGHDIKSVADGKYLVGVFYNKDHNLDFSYKADVRTFQKEVREVYIKHGLKWKAEEFDASSISDDRYERKDMTNILTFTIDPKGAKDLDDALSVEFRSEDGLDREWSQNPEAYARVTVHIADVTAFVTQNSELFESVSNRITSVYAPGMMAPMLPRELSEDKLSLQAGKKRPAVSISFLFSQDGNLFSSEEVFFRSKIQSDREFNYDDLDEMLKKDNFERENVNMKKAVDYLMKVAKQLKIDRNQQDKFGSQIQTLIVFDKWNQPCDFKQVFCDKNRSFTTHELIEEFMLLTNKSSAKNINIRRYHETPKIDAETDKELQQLGAPSDANFDSCDWSQMFPDPENRREAMAIWKSKWKPAQYGLQSDVEYAGHFALGETDYAHFTSPIRRFADMLAHLSLLDNVDERFLDFDKVNKVVAMAKKVETRAMEAALVEIIRRREEPIEILAEVMNDDKTQNEQLKVGMGGKVASFFDWKHQIPAAGTHVTLKLGIKIQNFPKHALELLGIKPVYQ